MVSRLRLLTLAVGLFYVVVFNTALANDDFNLWLTTLKQQALAAGISDKTATTTINHIELMPNVIKLDLAQPEFISPFLDYYYQRVDAAKIVRGRLLLAQHEVLLNQIEAQYGVPKALLVAFWGMETNYGSQQGNIDTLSTLATLAYDGRRAGFFRNQLLDAMRMIDAGNASVDKFRGSWAGAFGNMQFMPTTFMTYAVDGDGDKHIDIVNSAADAFASAANYLAQVGWHKTEPAMIEVQLPENFQWQNAQLNLRKSTEEWTNLGVKALYATNEYDKNSDEVNQIRKTSNGSKISEKTSEKAFAKSKISKIQSKNYQSNKTKNRYKNSIGHKKSATKKVVNKKTIKRPYQNSTSNDLIHNPLTNDALVSASILSNTSSQAAILLPQGWRGPAFMVFDNFDAIMDWNRSVNYALSVAQLAKRLQGESKIIGGQTAEAGALTFQQMFALQAALNKRGFDTGEPDGFPGLQTQAAVRAYQLSQNLPADGYASPSLYNRLQSSP